MVSNYVNNPKMGIGWQRCKQTIVDCVCYFTRRVRRRGGKPKSLKVSVRDEQVPMMTPRDPVELQRLNLETEGTAMSSGR